MSDTTHERLGRCEQCSKPIMPGDKATYGGPDAIWICEEHSSTLTDLITWYRQILADGSWDDPDYFLDSKDDVLRCLADAENELAATGNRTLAMVYNAFTTPAAVEALPIETAPKDGTMLRLLVDYTDEGENPLEDEHQAWTIGFNQLADTEEDVWEFAGWSWEQDCFTAGVGKVIGWLPFHPSARDLVPALAAERDAALTEAAALRKEVERLRAAMAPFDRMAGAMFARNWNKDGVALSFVERDGPIRLTFADFLAVRAALTAEPLGHGVTADDFGGEG